MRENYGLRYISEVESDLPEDIRDDALRVFRSAIADKSTIQDAINKVISHYSEFENLIKICYIYPLMRDNELIEMNSYLQVNKEALCEVEERFKGKRFKVRNVSWIDGHCRI